MAKKAPKHLKSSRLTRALLARAGRGNISLQRIMIPLNGDRPSFDLELGERELAAIGRVVVQWAYLEYALFFRSVAIAKRAKIPLSRDALSDSFDRRLEAFKDVVKRGIKSPAAKKRYASLADRIAALEDSRHRMAHNMWEFDPHEPDLLFNFSRRPPRNTQRIKWLKKDDLYEIGTRMGEATYELMWPNQRAENVLASSLARGGSVSRSFLLAAMGKRPEDLGFPAPVKASDESLKAFAPPESFWKNLAKKPSS